MVPTAWKQASITLIPKASATNHANFHPIALRQRIGKVYTTIKRLVAQVHEDKPVL